jgi:hypothetical protein
MEVIQTQIELELDKLTIFNLNKELKDKNIIRFAVINNNNKIIIDCAITINNEYPIKNIFEFKPRTYVNNEKFNVVLTIPTGIGAQIGGDSGDGNPAAKLLAGCCDMLITHPNVVNGADLNEMTENTLYVEGSILNRFMMGQIGLNKIRKNKILLIADGGSDIRFTINAASAGRVTLGADIDVLELNDSPLYESFYNENGIACGKIENLEKLLKVIKNNKDKYDSFALHTKIQNGEKLMDSYFKDELIVNPWGGIEAMITYSLSNIFDISVAHSPMTSIVDNLGYELPIVDPAKAPETLSITELHCVLKGMYKTPKIVEAIKGINGILTNSDIHALVIPDRCIGLQFLAAIEQNIPVIVIKDDKNIMKNDLSKFLDKEIYFVNNYFEAAGILTAIKNGISVNSLKRPIEPTKISVI